MGFVRSPLWGSPAHTSRLSLVGFWSADGEVGATPREGQNLEGWPQEIGNIVPVPDSGRRPCNRLYLSSPLVGIFENSYLKNVTDRVTRKFRGSGEVIGDMNEKHSRAGTELLGRESLWK